MAQELMLAQALMLSFAHKELHCLGSEKESDTRTVTQKTGGANPGRWALGCSPGCPIVLSAHLLQDLSLHLEPTVGALAR